MVCRVGLLDDGPFDFKLPGFVAQNVEQQIVERHTLQIETPQEFRFGPSHAAGPDSQYEEPAVAVSMLQALLEGPRFGHVGSDFDMARACSGGMTHRAR